ncbi:hypothetical protein HMPREF9061_00518 [Actinomyces sp. oral taxon 181 str. F0379]|nr:hypothetical protein HMPREF9061_00518 [Actinomyces sp. oral taxon 181 str. F0379]
MSRDLRHACGFIPLFLGSVTISHFRNLPIGFGETATRSTSISDSGGATQQASSMILLNFAHE